MSFLRNRDQLVKEEFASFELTYLEVLFWSRKANWKLQKLSLFVEMGDKQGLYPFILKCFSTYSNYGQSTYFFQASKTHKCHRTEKAVMKSYLNAFELNEAECLFPCYISPNFQTTQKGRGSISIVHFVKKIVCFQSRRFYN